MRERESNSFSFSRFPASHSFNLYDYTCMCTRLPFLMHLLEIYTRRRRKNWQGKVNAERETRAEYKAQGKRDMS